MKTRLSLLLYGLALLIPVMPGHAQEAHVFGTFILYDVSDDWWDKTTEARKAAIDEARALLTQQTDAVTIDAYWTYGLTSRSHLLLRLESGSLEANQRVLTQLQHTSLGHALRIQFTTSGVTKGLNYAPQFPHLLDKLKQATYQGNPPRYAIVIPTRKTAEWWNLPPEVRTGLMEEHAQATLDYLTAVKRKLYHATGLADLDFVTYFETNDLVAFNTLVIALRQVEEDLFNERLGEPTIIGTRGSVDDIFAHLASP